MRSTNESTKWYYVIGNHVESAPKFLALATKCRAWETEADLPPKAILIMLLELTNVEILGLVKRFRDPGW